jgi:hypothetical protein
LVQIAAAAISAVILRENWGPVQVVKVYQVLQSQPETQKIWVRLYLLYLLEATISAPAFLTGIVKLE